MSGADGASRPPSAIDLHGRPVDPKLCKPAILVQDGHTPGEHAVYNALWAAHSAAACDSREQFRQVSIGYDRLAAAVRKRAALGSKRNVQRLVNSLQQKSAIELVRSEDSAARRGKTYRVFGMAEILRRRRESGYTHVWRSRTAVELVRITQDEPPAVISLTTEQADRLTAVDKLTTGTVDKLTTGTVDRLTTGTVDRLTTGAVDRLTTGDGGQAGHAFREPSLGSSSRKTDERTSLVSGTGEAAKKTPSARPPDLPEIDRLKTRVRAYLHTRTEIKTTPDDDIIRQIAAAIGSEARFDDWRYACDNFEHPRKWAAFKSVAERLQPLSNLKRPAASLKRLHSWLDDDLIATAGGGK